MTTNLKGRNNKRLFASFLQVVFVPLLPVALVAAILIYVLGLDSSEQLTRGILYACLFLACVAVGHWKFSLASIGLMRKNIGRGFLYATIILVVGCAFMFLLQLPTGLTNISSAIWLPVLFYLAVALSEETWFRGLIFKALHDWGGTLPAVFGSVVLFGLMHVPMHGWVGLLYSLSIGLPYAVVRLKMGNLWGLIVVHWLTNMTDSFIRLSTTSLDLIWLIILHVLVFSGVSILIILLDKRLQSKFILHTKT